MIPAVMDEGIRPGLVAHGEGRFVPFFRNRPIGHESLRLSAVASGGLALRAETEIVLHRFALRQSVAAEFDHDLRPRCCRVTANTGPHVMQLALEIDGSHAVARFGLNGETRSVSTEITHEPLLLVDNCFSLHALAALAVSAQGEKGRSYLALPVAELLTAATPGVAPVQLGGVTFEPPTITLHLTPRIQEHAWVRGGWIDRLVVPQAQIRVDWLPGTIEGGL